jgi:hypothetical protein
MRRVQQAQQPVQDDPPVIGQIASPACWRGGWLGAAVGALSRKEERSFLKIRIKKQFRFGAVPAATLPQHSAKFAKVFCFFFKNEGLA